jgi:hypothetical protein
MIHWLIAFVCGAFLSMPAALAGNWYFGLGYAYGQVKDTTVQTTSLATSYARGGEVRVGWEYDWYLGAEAKYYRGYGQSGSVHSNLSALSIGVFLTVPKSISNWIYLTGGVAFLSAKSNAVMVTTKQDPADPSATVGTTTYVPYPSISKAAWFVGGGLRYRGKWLCPRAEIGYRGSDIGGMYAGVGLDFHIP